MADKNDFRKDENDDMLEQNDPALQNAVSCPKCPDCPKCIETGVQLGKTAFVIIKIYTPAKASGCLVTVTIFLKLINRFMSVS